MLGRLPQLPLCPWKDSCCFVALTLCASSCLQEDALASGDFPSLHFPVSPPHIIGITVGPFTPTFRLSAWSSLAPELTEDGVVPLNLLFCRVPPRWGLPAGVPGPTRCFAPGSRGPCARPLHLVFLLPNVCNPDPQASLLQIVFWTPLPWRAPDWRRFASPSESILCFTVIFFSPSDSYLTRHTFLGCMASSRM